MTAYVARVPAASASRYLQQLAKHWSHKLEVTFAATEATIGFPSGARLDMRADRETLDLVLAVPDGEDAARMQRVVEEHIDRFAFREGPLTYDWRVASTAS